MPQQLIGRHLLPGEENGWKLELYAVGAAISTAPTYIYTHNDPGPIQGDISWEYGGLAAVRGATLQTTEEVDWAPDAARGVRYAVRFYVRLTTGEYLRVWAGYVRDVIGGLGSGGTYTVQIGPLHDLNREGARDLGFVTVPGWVGDLTLHDALVVTDPGGTWGAYLDKTVATLAGGDHGVRADGLTVAGHPLSSTCVPVTLPADALHGLEYNGTEPPPYLSEVIARSDPRFPVTGQQRERPSVLTPRRVGEARTTDTLQPGTRLQKVREYGVGFHSALGGYYGVWNLRDWVERSIRVRQSDYDAHSVSFSRKVWMDPGEQNERCRVAYGIAVSTSPGGNSIGVLTAGAPSANIPGMVDMASQTVELSGSMAQYMKVELSQDWLQARGYEELYVWAWVVVGRVYTAADPAGAQSNQGLMHVGPEWVAAPVERVPTGALLDIPREYSYPYGTPGTWQAQVGGIVIPPAIAAVPGVSQPLAAARVTYTSGQAVTSIQTGVTTWG